MTQTNCTICGPLAPGPYQMEAHLAVAVCRGQDDHARDLVADLGYAELGDLLDLAQTLEHVVETRMAKMEPRHALRPLAAGDRIPVPGVEGEWAVIGLPFPAAADIWCELGRHLAKRGEIIAKLERERRPGPRLNLFVHVECAREVTA